MATFLPAIVPASLRNRSTKSRIFSLYAQVESRVRELAHRADGPHEDVGFRALVRWLRVNDHIGGSASSRLNRLNTLVKKLQRDESIAPESPREVLEGAESLLGKLDNILNNNMDKLVSLDELASAMMLPATVIESCWLNRSQNPAPHVVRNGVIYFRPSELEAWALSSRQTRLLSRVMSAFVKEGGDTCQTA